MVRVDLQLNAFIRMATHGLQIRASKAELLLIFKTNNNEKVQMRSM